MKWTAPKVVIGATSPESLPSAKAIAETTNLPLLSTVTEASASGGGDWVLLVSPDTLTLQRPDGLSTSIDFISGKAAQRSSEKSFASQPLARALGLQKLRKQSASPTVIDATAGFGTDAWMIASLGCSVRLLEAQPVLSTMLEHAVATAARTLEDSAASRMNVINTDATPYLTSTDENQADIVYLDPMYPASKSRALVKKGMQLLHELVGPDTNNDGLLSAALTAATYRVVVKRPKGAERLAGSENWSGQITDVSSPQTRFDIYHVATA